MPSKESHALANLASQFGALFPKDGNSLGEIAVYDQVHQLATEVPGVTYESVTVADCPCIWAKPQGASTKHAMLFMHGGGYSFGSPNGHRKLTAHLAKASNVPALSIDYRMAPKHPYPAAINDCANAYKWLLDQGFPAQNIVVAGDSCGGGLSAAVPLASIQRGWPVPGAAVSLSPWYDATNSGESFVTNLHNDVLNTKDFVDMLAERYTAGDKVLRKEPLVSPLFADLKGLPPTWISGAAYDMLFDNATRFAEKAKAAGVEIVLEVHEGQQHVFEFMAGKAPEADKSVKDIGDWVRQKIGS